ncbi:uncharacterized protein G2W53_038103 [Senna tora]|uniref:Uncharacterized protein n=1 Tax=Senna tora TaxID=362788 RepID=A0A834W1L8_9FABA|nr:uncharacterized protein G2W53_038103 [Senna tora]
MGGTSRGESAIVAAKWDVFLIAHNTWHISLPLLLFSYFLHFLPPFCIAMLYARFTAGIGSKFKICPLMTSWTRREPCPFIPPFVKAVPILSDSVCALLRGHHLSLNVIELGTATGAKSFFKFFPQGQSRIAMNERFGNFLRNRADEVVDEVAIVPF